MQLVDVKISNLLSYPYQAHLDRAPGIHFYADETNAISVLI